MYDLGLDIGGTTMKLGIFRGGKLIRTDRAPTPKDPDKVVDEIARMTAPIDYEAFGIATAGTVDREKKALSDLGGNISGWQGYPLGEALADKGIRLDVLENDINCALVGEMENRRDDHVLYVGMGTGIGGAFYSGGELYLGSRGSAMEIGHIVVEKGGVLCACGQRGCAESYFSARAFHALMKAAGYEGGDDFLASDEASAQEFIEGAADYLIGLENVLNPSAILIGGGMITYAPSIVARLKAAMLRRGNGNVRAPLEAARLGNDGGMVGAMLLAKKERRGHGNHL